jgi:translation initiation factor 3 subunit G
MAATKIRWGDTLDEDDSLPANSISGPDGRGVKTIVEYKRNDKGEAIKVTTKTRVSKVEKKVYKARPAARAARARRAARRPPPSARTESAEPLWEPACAA